MQFYIHCQPPKSTHQASQRILKNKKTGQMFIGKMNSSKGAAVRKDLITLLKPFAPAIPMEGPLQVCIQYTWSWRKGEPKKNRTAGHKYSDTRPDFDNLLKLMCDVMTKLGYWHDDGQIADGRMIKMWGDRPGMNVSIEPLEVRS